MGEVPFMPLAILPILFILLGLGEVAKITLITIGIAPCIVRDLAMRAAELPSEQPRGDVRCSVRDSPQPFGRRLDVGERRRLSRVDGAHRPILSEGLGSRAPVSRLFRLFEPSPRVPTLARR